MPAYFFHVLQADGAVTSDDIGAEFNNDERACEEANRALSEMVADIRPGSGTIAVEIKVQDRNGRLIAVRRARFEGEDFTSLDRPQVLAQTEP